jgi:hypothetical protein
MPFFHFALRQHSTAVAVGNASAIGIGVGSALPPIAPQAVREIAKTINTGNIFFISILLRIVIFEIYAQYIGESFFLLSPNGHNLIFFCDFMRPYGI